MTKKIVASAGILAAITALITGAATYASLSTRTESVRLVPMLVYDDNEVTRKAGVAGQTVPADLRNNVEYVLSDGVDVIADLSEININAADKRWVYKENETGDVNDRYYYYMAPLAPDEVSSCLLKAVTYKGALPADTHFELRVLAEGIARVQLEYVR